MPNRRRDFLGWLGASTILAATGSPLGAQSAARSPGRTPSIRPVTDEWDMTWVERIGGNARAVFDSPTVSEGSALWRAVGWRKDYQDVYGTMPGDVTAVLVIRHEAIELAMDDEYWARFRVGKRLKLRDQETGKWALANPIRAATESSPARYADFSLERFVATGGIVLACHLALLGRVAENYRKVDKLTSQESEAQARKHLLPGVILQPSGVFAVLRAQEAGCQYIVAS